MLYMKPDGTLVIDERPLPPHVIAEDRRREAKRKAENEKRYAAMKAQAEAAMNKLLAEVAATEAVAVIEADAYDDVSEAYENEWRQLYAEELSW